jgi:UDP-glucose 4-epimerase
VGQRLLVTGGAGFIGSHLSEHLLDLGHHVMVLDDLSTGSIENIQHLKSNERFEYVIDTVENRPVAAELVDRADQVVHLAAAVGVQLIVESPVRTIQTNVRGTEIVLELANKKHKPVLIASTSEVYGKSPDLPYSEEGDLVIGPSTKGRWAYACSKALDEFLAIAYFKERSLPTVILRLFNTVGPRQTGRYGMVIPRFVRQALANEPITVYGDGEQSRCFCHVLDVVEVIPRLLASTSSYGQVFNTGSTEEVSIMELARRVRDRTESQSEIVTVPYDKAYREGFEDMRRRIPSIEKIGNHLGWRPQRTLDATLDDVIEFERTKE